MAKADLTAARLRELLHYDPEAGIFTRLTRRQGTAPVGSVAGGVGIGGYVQIGIDRKLYYGHRLAWLYMTGAWPPEQIDHIDGDRANNRFANLRSVPRRINNQNRRKAQSNSKSGVLGVHWRPERQNWRAVVTVDGRVITVGSFDSKDDAERAQIEAKRRLHEGCTI